MPDPDKSGARLIERQNELRLKTLGTTEAPPGQIDPEALKAAQTVIDSYSEQYMGQAVLDLKALQDGYTAAMAVDGAQRLQQLKQLVFTAHSVQDMGATFGYDLITAIGKSLCDYLEDLQEANPDRLFVVKAHIDAMAAVVREKIRGHGGNLGVSMVDSLQKAVTKVGAK